MNLIKRAVRIDVEDILEAMIQYAIEFENTESGKSMSKRLPFIPRHYFLGTGRQSGKTTALMNIVNRGTYRILVLGHDMHHTRLLRGMSTISSEFVQIESANRAMDGAFKNAIDKAEVIIIDDAVCFEKAKESIRNKGINKPVIWLGEPV